jgi:hypothetical protein
MFLLETVFIAFKSWKYRMFVLTDEELKNKVPKNNSGIYSIYCDKSNWTRHHRGGKWDRVKNFWLSINDGYIDMLYDYLESVNSKSGT